MTSSRKVWTTGSNDAILDDPYVEQLIHVNHTNLRLEKGVEIKADAANTNIVYVGPSDVTAGTNAETDGIPLAAGESVFLPIREPEEVYVVADNSAGAKVYYALI